MKVNDIPIEARKALAEGKIQEANAILSDYYSLKGTVVEGRHLGRILGFPTANLEVNKIHPLIIPNGVYAVRIKYQATMYNGMVNIGIRPTFDQHEVTIEVNLFDFSGDLYGHELTLFFIERIRDEMKFPDPEALKRQITIDKLRIAELLTGRDQPDPYSK
jgi:riboflavin kinase/FMN adenylyltransferase